MSRRQTGRPLVYFHDGHVQPELFDAGPDGLAAVRTDWLHAFDAWATAMQAAGTLRSPGTVRTYGQLWQPLADWALRQSPPVALDALTEEDLAVYIAGREGRGEAGQPVTPRHAWRLLWLVDRVLLHRAGQRALPTANRCADRLLKSRPEWRYAHTPEYAPTLDHLSAREARTLVRFLTEALPRAGRRAALTNWRDLRAATAVALHLGGGLTPGEVRELKVDDVRPGERPPLVTRVVVRAHGQTPERQVPIAAWAARAVRAWLAVRQELQMQGDWLLPSTRSGNPWKKASHNNAVNALLESAGLEGGAAEGGSFRLRHTFALRQLARGTSLEDLGILLGLRDDDALARYRAIVPPRIAVF